MRHFANIVKIEIVISAVFFNFTAFGVSYTVTDLTEAIGGDNIQVNGINNHSQIIGTMNGNNSFIWDSTNGVQMIASEESAYGINDSGQVVGTFGLWQNGTITRLAGLSGQSNWFGTGYSISNTGKIAGMSWNVNQNRQASMWNSPDEVIGLPFTGGSWTEAFGINDSGQVTGFYEGGGTLNAFYWDSIHGMVGIEGFGRSVGYGINNLGQIVGSTGTSNDRAFLWEDLNGNFTSDPGEMITLGTLGGGSYGRSVNDSGQVVGYSNASYDNNWEHAFLWDRVNGMVDLMSLLPEGCGWQRLNYAAYINNNGQIVGTGYKTDGQWHAFLMEPVPEPVTILLMGLGAVMMRKRKS